MDKKTMPDPVPPTARLAQNLNVWLLRRGFSSKTLRLIALYEIVGCALVLAASVILLPLTLTRALGLWLFWFSLGMVAGTANFIILVISGQRLIKAAMVDQGGSPRRGISADVAGILLKLLLTAVLFCAATFFWRASIIALLGGYTLPVVIMLALGIIYARQNGK